MLSYLLLVKRLLTESVSDMKTYTSLTTPWGSIYYLLYFLNDLDVGRFYIDEHGIVSVSPTAVDSFIDRFLP